MSDAVQDIKFLSERFRGILALSDTLTTKATLDNQVTELTKVVSDMKKTYNDLSSKYDDIKKTSDNLDVVNQNSLKAAEKTIQEKFDAADKECRDIIKDTNAQAEEILKSARVQLNTINETIKSKNHELYSISSEVNAAQVRLKNANQELTKLREKL